MQVRAALAATVEGPVHSVWANILLQAYPVHGIPTSVSEVYVHFNLRVGTIRIGLLVPSTAATRSS